MPLAKAAGVTADRQRHLDGQTASQFEPLGVSGGAEETGQVFDQISKIEVDGLQLEASDVHLGEVQDVVDDAKKCFTRGEHRLGELPLVDLQIRFEK